MRSIIQKEKECYLCSSTLNLENHHVCGGVGRRKWSDKYGLCVWLCPLHHRDAKQGVHGLNKEADLYLKQTAQKAFEERHPHELWMQKFGKNYL